VIASKDSRAKLLRKLCQAIKDDTNSIRTTIPTIQHDLHTVRASHDHAQHKELMSWISPTDFSAQHSDIFQRRQEGTGQWFLDTAEFANWLDQDKSTLFCPGIPGAGKTIIAAIAIEHLLRSVQNSTVGVAFVYCNYKNQREQNIASLLAIILRQLVQVRPLMEEPVRQLHQRHADRGGKPTIDEITAAMHSVLTEFSSLYVVIDALDECRDSDGTRRQFLAQIQTLQARTNVHLMASSRLIPDVANKLKEASTVEVRAKNEDVRRYVAGQLYRLPKCIQRDPALQDVVLDKIVESVDGM
jgi:hypothetical protein